MNIRLPIYDILLDVEACCCVIAVVCVAKQLQMRSRLLKKCWEFLERMLTLIEMRWNEVNKLMRVVLV